MKLHQQFDVNIHSLNVKNFNNISRVINKIPDLVENLIEELLEKGYFVIRDGSNQIGIPKSITLVKDFSGPFVTNFSLKMKEDFNSVSKALGIEKLFE